MAQILLSELNRADLDRLAQIGQPLEMTTGQVLVEADQPLDRLFIVLDGMLDLVLPTPESASAEPLGQLVSGDLTGALLPDPHPLPYRVRAARHLGERTTVLAVPQSQVLTQAQQDPGFGARLYRSIALGLARQHSQFVAVLSQQNRMPPLFVPKSIFSVFSCLQDTDICWMLGFGMVQRLEANSVCLAQGRSPEALYITLKGSLAVWLNDSPHRAMALTGAAPAALAERAVSQILPGELVGLSQFLEFGQHQYTIRANQDALVLTLPIPVLEQKLQQDPGFAARFYQAAASLMAERTAQLFGALNYGDRCYECGDSLCSDQFYDDELALKELQQTSLARARFSWMLKQLNIRE